MVHKTLAVGTKKFPWWNSFGGCIENCACSEKEKGHQHLQECPILITTVHEQDAL